MFRRHAFPKEGILTAARFRPFLGGAWLSFSALVAWRLETVSSISAEQLPSLKGLRPASVAAVLMGQRSLLGDLYWAGILQYCGDADNGRQGYPLVLQLCLEASTLSPDQAAVYKYGAAFLAWYAKRPAEGALLLKRGILSLRDGQDRDRLQLYLAAVEYQNLGMDKESLAFLARLFEDSDAPPLLGPILANTLAKMGNRDAALRVWGLILEREGPETELGRRALVKASELKKMKKSS